MRDGSSVRRLRKRAAKRMPARARFSTACAGAGAEKSFRRRNSCRRGLREALHALQLSFRRVPGLVADGRDMGTVVFPDALLKVFLTASAAMRAERRLKQLISKGISATLADLRAELEARDARDVNRAVSPLRPAQDALQLDNSSLTIEQSADRVLQWWNERNVFD